MSVNAPTDDGLCEWCGELNNGSTFSPFCSEACEDNAENEAAEHGTQLPLNDQADHSWPVGAEQGAPRLTAPDQAERF